MCLLLKGGENICSANIKSPQTECDRCRIPPSVIVLSIISPISLKLFCQNLTCKLSGLNQWGDIEKLNFFPKLEEVRLQGIPLLQTYTNAERRSLIIAQWVFLLDKLLIGVCTVKHVCVLSQASFNLTAKWQRGDWCGERRRREILHPLLFGLPRRGAAFQVYMVDIKCVHTHVLVKLIIISSVDTIVL